MGVMIIASRDFQRSEGPKPDYDFAQHQEFVAVLQKALLRALVQRGVLTGEQVERCFAILEK